jgi:hypothetical protein
MLLPGQFDAIGIAREAIENGIGDSRISNGTVNLTCVGRADDRVDHGQYGYALPSQRGFDVR